MRSNDEVNAEIRRLVFVRESLNPENTPDSAAVDAMIRVLSTDINAEEIKLLYQNEYTQVLAIHALNWKDGKFWADSPSIDWTDRHAAA